MSEESLTLAADNTGLSVWSAEGNFELGQRMAKALYTSGLVPTQYQGPQNLGSCLIALDMASRMNLSPLSVMQNLNIIKGKPSWGASFLIARANNSGKFKTPIRYEWFGEPGKDNWACRAWTTDHDGTTLRGTVVSMAMAKAEGWCAKNDKWKNMPEQMLQYRAAAFLIRTHAPELMFGILETTEEREDMVMAQPKNAEAEPQKIVDVAIEEIPVAEPHNPEDDF